MRNLVTGATGLLGNNLVRLLLDRGEDVRVLVRRGSDRRPLAGLDLEVVHGDLTVPDSVSASVRGAERVFHAAAYVHVGRTAAALHQAVNVDGTAAVARACRTTGARLVHVSTVDALGWGTRAHPADEDTPPGGEPRIPYVTAKREAERRVLAEVSAGLDAVIVNPAYLLGPWDWKPSSGRMLLEVARGAGMFAPPGGNDFCDVRAVAAGVLSAAERGRTGRRYVLGGEALSYLEAWRLFARVSGAREPLAEAPVAFVRIAGRLGDVVGRLTGREPDVNTAAADIALRPHHFSSRRAQSELGYEPGRAEDAARAAWHWFVEHGYA